MKKIKHCRNVIKNDPDNIRFVYTEPTSGPLEASPAEITNDFENFWRPIWKGEKETNLDAPWINKVKEAIKEVIPAPSDDLVIIRENDIQANIRSKRSWSSPGND